MYNWSINSFITKLLTFQSPFWSIQGSLMWLAQALPLNHIMDRKAELQPIFKDLSNVRDKSAFIVSPYNTNSSEKIFMTEGKIKWFVHHAQHTLTKQRQRNASKALFSFQSDHSYLPHCYT